MSNPDLQIDGRIEAPELIADLESLFKKVGPDVDSTVLSITFERLTDFGYPLREYNMLETGPRAIQTLRDQFVPACKRLFPNAHLEMVRWGERPFFIGWHDKGLYHVTVSFSLANVDPYLFSGFR